MAALKRKGRIALPAVLALTAGWVMPAMAIDGDFLPQGTKYCADTYTRSYPGVKTNHPSIFGATNVLNVVDITFPGDGGTVLSSPADGYVTVRTTGWGDGWGNSIIWESLDRTEKFHLAHLQRFGKTGKVDAGEDIGVLGSTGNSTGTHLHVSRQKNGKQVPVVMSGTALVPAVNPNLYGAWPCNSATYTSKGSIGAGPGGPEPVDPSDPPASGKLPDFITSKVILANSNKTGERYTWKVNETPYVHAWLDNIGKADWQGSADNIKVPFYLSKGTKKDSSSEWVRVGREQIKKKNVEVKDKPKEEKIAFNIPQWAAAGYIYPGRTYNFVVCADRPKDQDNGDGDVKEIHKSNNCSTPAVFYVDYGPARNVDVMASNLALAGGKSSLQAGEAYGFQADISNIGTEYPWNGCRTNYEIKGPGTGGVWQKVADEGSTAAQLGPNSTHVEVIDESRGLKAPAVGGDYVFRACADYEQAIPETDESNNCTAELPVRVEAPLPPPPPSVTPRIVITNPTSGDDWRSDETDHDVEWEHYDFPTLGNVKIEYSLDDGATWLLIDDNTTNDGKKHWHDMCDFHTVDTHHAYVRITSLDYPGVVGMSDEFLIDHAKECK